MRPPRIERDQKTINCTGIARGVSRARRQRQHTSSSNHIVHADVTCTGMLKLLRNYQARLAVHRENWQHATLDDKYSDCHDKNKNPMLPQKKSCVTSALKLCHTASVDDDEDDDGDGDGVAGLCQLLAVREAV